MKGIIMLREQLTSLAFVVTAMFGTLAEAGDKYTVGTARLFTNDFLGDGHDRWRSGGYGVSMMRSEQEWKGSLPYDFGAMVEYRFRTDILAPANLVTGGVDGRRYAGTLTFGMHSYFNRNAVDYNLGVDLVAVGPSTGVGRFHKVAHRLVGAPTPDVVLDNQMKDAIMPTLSGAVSRQFLLGDNVSVRPFAGFRVGDETFARIGADFIFGAIGQSDLWVRDVTTGHLVRAVFASEKGTSFVLGGDVAWVEDSRYIPASDGISLTQTRVRARAGVLWQGKKNSIFYGLTYLGKEFDEQPSGQIVGSVALRRRF